MVTTLFMINDGNNFVWRMSIYCRMDEQSVVLAGNRMKYWYTAQYRITPKMFKGHLPQWVSGYSVLGGWRKQRTAHKLRFLCTDENGLKSTLTMAVQCCQLTNTKLSLNGWLYVNSVSMQLLKTNISEHGGGRAAVGPACIPAPVLSIPTEHRHCGQQAGHREGPEPQIKGPHLTQPKTTDWFLSKPFKINCSDPGQSGISPQLPLPCR